MKIVKYSVTLLSVLAVPAAFGQALPAPAPAPTTCLALPAGTTLPAGYVLPPGVCLCPTAPAAAPAPAAAAPAPAPATTVSGSMNNGEGDEHDSDEAHEHPVFTGTISGDTLTVTSILHGKFRIGTKLSGTGIPRGTEVKAYGTGHGGVGTYKIGMDEHKEGHDAR